MANNIFNANSWINFHELDFNNSKSNEQLPDLTDALRAEEEQEFNPQSFLVPGWKGQGIMSNNSLMITKLMDELQEDAKHQLFTVNLTANLRSEIFNEFVEFVHDNEVTPCFISDALTFCNEMQNFTSLKNDSDEIPEYYGVLDRFCDAYSRRLVIIYTYKLKFMTLFSLVQKLKVTDNNILNPQNFFAHTFLAGQATHVVDASFLNIQNKFSWYIPHRKFTEKLRTISPKLLEISVTETMKIISDPKGGYSHAISHQSFGIFMNHLLIHFPRWMNKKYSMPKMNRKRPGVVSCKMSGKYIESFITSHWLAQKACIAEDWDQLLSPECMINDKDECDFVKVYQELQYCYYLTLFANNHHYDAKEFLLDIFAEKLKKSSNVEQLAFFAGNKVYDRIVLNHESSRTNAHPDLLSKIQSQHQYLADKGLLFIWTNQNFFVPSQKEKIATLLKNFKLEANFNFENLIGRGEIPQFLYVFSKKEIDYDIFTDIPTLSGMRSDKETCFTFKFAGNIEIFQNFAEFSEALTTFFRNKENFGTPYYGATTKSGLSFKFYKDSIIDCVLHSMESDSSIIAIPDFYEKVTNNGLPLSQFFNITALDESYVPTNDVFGVSNRPDHILIINLTDSNNISLELCQGDLYLSKRKQYGQACYKYFGLVQKMPNININLFDEYFSSPFGKQVIQFCLSSQTKLKSQLNSLLVPHFLSNDENRLSEAELRSIALIMNNRDELVKVNSEDLLKNWNDISDRVRSLSSSHPWEICSRLNMFKNELNWALDSFKTSQHNLQNLDFNNKYLYEPLTKVPRYHIALHEDIHITPLLIPLKQLSDDYRIEDFKVQERNKVTVLTIFSRGQALIELNACIEMLEFINFILKMLNNKISIRQFLQSVTLPREEAIKSAISNFFDNEDHLRQMYNNVQNEIVEIYSEQLFK